MADEVKITQNEEEVDGYNGEDADLGDDEMDLSFLDDDETEE